MKKTIDGFFIFDPSNRKSKIEIRKLAELFAFVVAFTLCGAMAEAQQTGKVPA